MVGLGAQRGEGGGGDDGVARGGLGGAQEVGGGR